MAVSGDSSKEIWNTFPTLLDEGQAWVSYNHSYAAIATVDGRDTHVRIRIKLAKTNAQGMPTPNEFAALSKLDKRLKTAITGIKGAYVGHITLSGYRYFYYYIDCPFQFAEQAFKKAAKGSGYAFEMFSEADSEKKCYWNELFPTKDDEQVIADVKALGKLNEQGDQRSVEREVDHLARFADDKSAAAFSDWAVEKGYTLLATNTEDEGEHHVAFRHVGAMQLGQITQHSIAASRKARLLKGQYDGWETIVQKRPGK